MQPKYKQAYQVLLTGIYEKRWPAGSRLPALPELARQLCYTEWATERALNLLIAQGLLSRSPKQGTSVAERPTATNAAPAPVVFMGYGIEAVVDTVTNMYSLPMISAMQERLPGRDWVFLNNRAAGEVALALRMLGASTLIAVNQRVDHIELLDQFALSGVQVLCLGTRVPSSRIHYVAVNNTKGMLDGLRYLARLGHRRVAFLGYPQQVADHIERVRAFRLGRARFGMDRDPELLVWREHPEGYQALADETVRHWFALPQPPTAIFCGGFDMLLALLPALQAQSIGFPNDVSLITFDDIPMVAQFAVPLTVIRQPLEAMGHRAARAIEQLSDAFHPIIRVVLPPTLIVRESCAPPPSKTVRATGW